MTLANIHTRLAVVIGMITVMAAGCSFGDKPAEKIYTHLEEAAMLEQDFTEQQEKIVDAEKKEQQLYNEMIEMSMDDFEQIVSLSKQADQLANDRKQWMKEEKDILDEAYQTFTKAQDLVKEIENDELKQSGRQLLEAMENRHETYDKLFDAYMVSIERDRKLYNMFREKELKANDLQDQIDQVNASYKKVNETKDRFNEYTERYNETKKNFYETAELNVDVDRS